MTLDLRSLFGDIDIYLFDQLLKGRFSPDMRLLDCGCGSGRNLVYFLREGYQVFAVDQSREAVDKTRSLAAELAPQLSSDNFQVSAIEHLPFPDNSFDIVLSSAVLHFARDEQHWNLMIDEMWRVLRARGVLFARLASSIGIESQVKHINGRRFLLPDGSERFLIDESMLTTTNERLKGKFLEPIKTVVVQNMRAMTTWVTQKQ